MKEIILSGSEYKKLSTMKTVDQIAIFYDKEGNVLIYEEDNNKITAHLPKVTTSDNEQFYSFLSSTVGIPFSQENLQLFLRLEDYYMKFEKSNKKLKKAYIEKVRDYYSCCVDFASEIKMQPNEYFGKVTYPKVISIDEAIERNSLHYNHSHTGYALSEFQKVKKR